MKDLIEALTILLKYGNPGYPTMCEHDVLRITQDINPEDVSREDKAKLEELGFEVDDDLECFFSYRFGSA